jgi:hypothetical protein
MIKTQPYYRLAEKGKETSLVKIHLTPRVIYLKEFYRPELVWHYFKTLLPRLVDRKSSNLFLFTGTKGAGKTSFVHWMINGIHSKRPVLFLDHTDFTARRIQFIETFLAAEPNTMLVIELDGLSKMDITDALTIAYRWAAGYKGVKIMCLKEGDFHGHLAPGDYPLLRVLPFFTALPVEQVNKVLERMGLRQSANHEMTLREIFELVARENVDWTIMQQ